jgi:adenylate cyclase
MTPGPGPRRTSLFWKYFATLFAAVVAPLLIAGGSEAWLGYRDKRVRLNDILNAEARLAAVKIEDFIDGIREQLGWAVQLPWSEETGERHRLDALRLLRLVPAVESLTLVDAAGRERLFVSRIGLNRIEGRADLSLRPAVRGARANGSWFGPVNFHDGSEPFMMIAVAGNRSSVGVAIAEVNLKFIWEEVSGIKVGRTGDAFVLDRRAQDLPRLHSHARATSMFPRPWPLHRAHYSTFPTISAAGAIVTG